MHLLFVHTERMNITINNTFKRPPFWRWWDDQSRQYNAEIEKRLVNNNSSTRDATTTTSLQHANDSNNSALLRPTTAKTQIVLVILFMTLILLAFIIIILYTCRSQGSSKPVKENKAKAEEEEIADTNYGRQRQLLYPPQKPYHILPWQQQQKADNISTNNKMTIIDNCPPDLTNLLSIVVPTNIDTTSRTTNNSRFQEHFF